MAVKWQFIYSGVKHGVRFLWDLLHDRLWKQPLAMESTRLTLCIDMSEKLY